MRKRFPLLVLLSIITAVFFARCANRVAPAGGLEDKTPPTVVSTMPAPEGLRVPVNQAIEFKFSKWIKDENIDKAIFVSPTQPVMKVRAYGRSLRLVPQGRLKDSTTYVVVLGSEIQDMRGNKLAQSYSLSFSTGAFLDSGQISGKVYDNSGRPLSTGVSLFAYFEKDTGAPDPMKDVPEYVTQSGIDGGFVLKNLKPGRFRVFAVTDLNRNRRFNPEREMIGIPSCDVSLTPKQPRAGGLAFFPARQDTLPLTLDKVMLKPGGQLFVSFNKQVADSPGLDPAHYTLLPEDSLGAGKPPVPVTAINRLPLDSLSLLFLIGPTTARQKYRCRGLGLFASDGALLDTARSSAEFGGNPEADSVAPQLLAYDPPKYAPNVAETDSLSFVFSEPVRGKDLFAGFSLERLTISKRTADSSAKFDTLAEQTAGKGALRTPLLFVFQPDSPLTFGAVYRWRLRPEKLVDLAGNFSLDTTMKGSFTVIGEGEYGTLSGKVADSNAGEFRVPLLARTGKKAVEAVPAKSGYYTMDHVPEGDYRLMAWRDANHNGRWDAGRLKPFAFAERMVVAVDSVHVRKRWDVEHLDITPGK
jgi:hypothetical protein